MTIEKFKVQDYADIELANGVGFENWDLPHSLFQILDSMERSKMFYTVRDSDGEVLAIGGFFMMSTKACEAAFYPSVKFCQNPRRVLKIVKSQIQWASGYFNRVQMNCLDQPRFIRFAEYLGFKPEGRLQKYHHDGSDHIMMAIVR